LISAAAFVYLAWSVGSYNTAISRIVIADCIAVICLAIAAVCQIISSQMLIVAGVIHLLPLPGLIGATHLERLYGTTLGEPNLLIIHPFRNFMNYVE
jgi:hypothetical protein